jgi:hypothetical protein
VVKEARFLRGMAIPPFSLLAGEATGEAAAKTARVTVARREALANMMMSIEGAVKLSRNWGESGRGKPDEDPEGEWSLFIPLPNPDMHVVS